MGIRKYLKGFRKKQRKQEAQEINKRVEEFKAEYRALRAKYGLDFRSYFSYLEDGQGIVAAMKIIDVSDEVNTVAEAERKQKEWQAKQENKNGN